MRILILVLLAVLSSCQRQYRCNQPNQTNWKSLLDADFNNEAGGHVQYHVGKNCGLGFCFLDWDQMFQLFTKLGDNCVCQEGQRRACQVIRVFQGYINGTQPWTYARACFVFSTTTKSRINLITLTAYPVQYDDYNCQRNGLFEAQRLLSADQDGMRLEDNSSDSKEDRSSDSL